MCGCAILLSALLLPLLRTESQRQTAYVVLSLNPQSLTTRPRWSAPWFGWPKPKNGKPYLIIQTIADGQPKLGLGWMNAASVPAP